MSDDALLDPKVEARAREWLRRKQSGDFDASQWHEGFRQFLTPEQAAKSSALLGPLGEPLELAFIDAKTNARGITTYRFYVTFAGGRIEYLFGLFEDGIINQISFRPIPGEPGPFDHLMPATQ